MNNLMDLKHQHIKDYISEKLSSEQQQKIQSLKNEIPSFFSFLEIVDELKQNSKEDITLPQENAPESFADIEAIILEIQSGSVDGAYALKILGWLIKSQNFYEKIVTKLDQISTIQIEDEPPELQEVAIKTDDEILAQAGILQRKQVKETSSVLEKVKIYINGLIDRIVEWFQEKPKLAYSVISVLIISISSPIGIRFYNTSYQLILAENILQDNYRIYMSETPRLSGGYGSTGISMLMSDEEEEEDSYISKAFEKVNKVNDYDSKLPEAKQLQAQIFFIQKQYAKADSVLNLIDENEKNTASILNDIGVIQFAQNDFEKSIPFFESAIKSNPDFNEAYYNLALVYEKLGKKNESIQLINKFLQIEHDEGWRNAALNLIIKLKQ